MADEIEKKSIRLLDGDIRLYPRVLLEDVLKSVAPDGSETVAKLVESAAAGVSSFVYGRMDGNDPDTQIHYSQTPVANRLVMYGLDGVLKVGTPKTGQDAVNKDYADSTYTGLSKSNNFTGLNNFEQGITVGISNSRQVLVDAAGIRIKNPGDDTYTITVDWPELNSSDDFAVVSQVNTAKSEAISTAQSYTDSQINAKLSSALKYKGSVENYSDLPKTGQQIGDTWNVANAYGNAHAGTNWAWNGTTWDPLGGTIDLTNYVTMTNAAGQTETIILAAGAGGRGIKDSPYKIVGTVTDNATSVPTANAVYSFVNSKISGSIWDSTKVLYGESNDSAAFGTARYILTSQKDSSGHLIAKESYLLTNSVEDGGENNIPSAAAVYIAVEGRVDKRTTSGNFVYTHTNATQSEIGYNAGAVASTIALRDAKGRLAAISAGYAFNVSTGSNIISVTGGDAASCTTGTELNALANAVNTISGNLKNLMISYEEVASA